MNAATKHSPPKPATTPKNAAERRQGEPAGRANGGATATAQADGDPPAPSPENEERLNRQLFASATNNDLEAVQRVLDSMVDQWANGYTDADADTPGDTPLAVAGCRVASLALAAIIRSVEYAAEARDWSPREGEKRKLS